MSTHKYQRIFESIKHRILNGEYPPGMRLPGVVSLSQEYDVSRITSNRVLRELELAGLAERRERIGTFVLNRPTALRDIFVFAGRDYDRSAHLFEYWRGIVDRAETNQISTHLVHVSDPRLESTVQPDQFVGQGVIFLEDQQTPLAAALKRSGVPTVYLGIRPRTRDHFVNEDRRGAARELVTRLRRDRYRRIAFLANLSAPNHREARAGYLEAIADLNLGHSLIRDVDDSSVAAILRELTELPQTTDSAVIVGSHLPIAALAGAARVSDRIGFGFLFGSRRILSLNAFGYVAFYDHRTTGALVVDALQDLVSDASHSPPRARYVGYTIYAPGEYQDDSRSGAAG